MDWVKAALLTGLLSLLLMYLAPATWAAEYGRRNSCRRADRLQIQDLDMSPDPIVEGQRLREWKVRIHFDGRRNCETDIVVHEGGNNVGYLRNYNLRPGINEVTIPVSERFSMRGREHCFTVQVDLDGTRQRVDADRRFCAAQRTMWSMRERGDPRRR
jgi:hypothetical protein